MIPKVIHYCWFGKNPLPEKVKKCIESWKKFCPDYEIKLWDESNFDYNQYTYSKEAYEQKKWAFVSDVARLDVVYKYGGIYLDTDVELIKPLDELLKYDSFWGFEDPVHIATGLGFGACKQNKYVKAILDDYMDKKFVNDDGSINKIPCTDLNTKIFKEMGILINNQTQIIDNNIFLSTEYLCPLDYATGKLHVTKKTISIHRYDSSWASDSDRFLHKVEQVTLNLFGSKVSKKITHFCELLVHQGVKGVVHKITHKN